VKVAYLNALGSLVIGLTQLDVLDVLTSYVRIKNYLTNI